MIMESINPAKIAIFFFFSRTGRVVLSAAEDGASEEGVRVSESDNFFSLIPSCGNRLTGACTPYQDGGVQGHPYVIICLSYEGAEPMSNYVYLAIAIVAEVIATSALKASDSFTRLWPSAVTVVGYLLAFYFLALTLRTIPVGIAYAVWSGTGIVLVSIIAWFLYGQKLDAAALVGMGLIIAGVLVINLLSKSAAH
jgi:small multidrug resistance pump